MLRWGAVGVGTVIEGTIAPAMAADPNSVLAAVVSRDAGRAEGVASRWGATGFNTVLGVKIVVEAELGGQGAQLGDEGVGE